jgi:predicted phosphoribosyltransferase
VIFADRQDAGARLAKELARFKDADPVVLALARGGVPVALEVAQALDAPLDVVVVRKIGAPSEPGLPIAAIVDGDRADTVLDDILQGIPPPRTWLRDQIARELREIEEQRRRYRADADRPHVRGRTAILVDDGIATGTSTRAALRAVRRLQPKRLVLAVPVAPEATLETLRPEVDEVVCLATPPSFGAVGQFYRDFPTVGDDAVCDLMARAPHRQSRSRPVT